MSQTKHYANIEEFYEDRGGKRSGERDFGVWHIDDCGLFSGRTDWSLEAELIHIDSDVVARLDTNRNNRIRVSVVDQTGDIYATQLGIGEWRVALIGNVGITNPDYNNPTPADDDIGPVYCVAEEILSDWAGNEGLGRGISWFINRIREATPMTSKAPSEPDSMQDFGSMTHPGIETFERYTKGGSKDFSDLSLQDAVIFQLYAMYCEEIWCAGWMEPTKFQFVQPSNLMFRDWVIDRFEHQIINLLSTSADDLPEVRRQWNDAIDELKERSYDRNAGRETD